MRTGGIAVLLLASLCAGPGPAAGQAPAPLQQSGLSGELARRVKAGDLIAVRLATGEDVVGTFSSASDSSLVLTPMGKDATSHERQVVYRRAAPTVRVAPVVAPGRTGVMLFVQFRNE